MSSRTRGFVGPNGRLTLIEPTATLEKFLPESEGKSVPPEAQRNFSFRFTGVPPIGVYETWPEWDV